MYILAYQYVYFGGCLMFLVGIFDQDDMDAYGCAIQWIINIGCKGDHALTHEEALQEKWERMWEIHVRLWCWL